MTLILRYIEFHLWIVALRSRKGEKGREEAMVAATIIVLLFLTWHASTMDDPRPPPSQLSTEAQALLAFRHSLNSPSTSLPDWDPAFSSSPLAVCNWAGVTCDAANQTVVMLELPYRNLTGTLSPELGNLVSLQVLNVSGNSLSGPIPLPLFQRCPRSLVALDLSHNLFSGSIPGELGNCSGLMYLDVGSNQLSGPIPSLLRHLAQLRSAVFSFNHLNGQLSTVFSNSTQLASLRLEGNLFQGSIPTDFCYNLEGLQVLGLSYNQLSGVIPAGLLLNCSANLLNVGFENNFLQGHIPSEFGQLPRLNMLWMSNNNLSGPIPVTLGNLTALTILHLSFNRLTGDIPDALAALHHSIKVIFGLTNNLLSGPLPVWLGNFTGLQYLKLGQNGFVGSIPAEYSSLTAAMDVQLHNNFLTGEIPPELLNLPSLVRLELGNNRLQGRIPANIPTDCKMIKLDLSGNQLTGSIPASLFSCSALGSLSLGWNNLGRSIPPEISKLQNIVNLSMESNRFSGLIPSELGSMAIVMLIDLSVNNLSGPIPSSLSLCSQLQSLNLSFNHLQDTIPGTLSDLKSLSVLDLSHNSLSGSIPAPLLDLPLLELLNLSDNSLSGAVPASGTFLNFTASGAFSGNQGLCGPMLHRICSQQQTRLSPHHHHRSPVWITVVAVVAAAGLLFVASVAVYYMRRNKQKKSRSQQLGMEQLQFDLFKGIIKFKMTEREVHKATDGFNLGNVIGVGGSGVVYRGIMSDGSLVAIKVLKRSTLYSGGEEHDLKNKSFDAELRTVAKVRHRNLVQVLGYCSEGNTKALIMELLLNGNLEQRLHGSDAWLRSWREALNIMMGIAEALVYLHYECGEPILHLDLKPSNILLDADMQPHVADFGLAKTLHYTELSDGITASNFCGSIGYLAPEYANSGRVSAKVDVYSFGVMLLELMTRRRPSHDMFCDGLTLPKWVRSAYEQGSSLALVDPSFVATASIEDSPCHQDSIMSITTLALKCTEEIPEQRPNFKMVKEAIAKLQRNESTPIYSS